MGNIGPALPSPSGGSLIREGAGGYLRYTPRGLAHIYSVCITYSPLSTAVCSVYEFYHHKHSLQTCECDYFILLMT